MQPGSLTQGSVVQKIDQQNDYAVMRKRYCSNTRGVQQTTQHGNPAINQHYQQSQPQIAQQVSQPPQVYQPSYRSNQSANMTSDQSDGCSNQVNTAQNHETVYLLLLHYQIIINYYYLPSKVYKTSNRRHILLSQICKI